MKKKSGSVHNSNKHVSVFPLETPTAFQYTAVFFLHTSRVKMMCIQG